MRSKLKPVGSSLKQSKTVTQMKDQAEDRLRKIRSEALLPVREEDTASIGTGKGKKGAKDKPSSNISSTPVSAIDKRKGKAIEEPRGRSPGPSEQPDRAQQPATQTGEDHQCPWRDKFDELKYQVDEQGQTADDIGLEGLTIVLHMKGRDDLVINTDLRNLE